jgi:GntR family transcriptional regulator
MQADSTPADSGRTDRIPADLGDVLHDLDRTGHVPLYHQIATRLRDAISNGALPTGSRLENEVALAERIGVSRPTMRRAIQDLVDRGLLVRRRGVGTQVVGARVHRHLELSSLHEDLTRSGHATTTQVLRHELVPAPPLVASQLGIAPGVEVLSIRRLRFSDGVPLAVLENHLPPGLSDITPEQLEEQGLYALLRNRGVSMRVARQTIGARAAARDEAHLLGIATGAPVLTMTRVVFDDSGASVETGSHSYVPDLYTFEITLVER